MSKPSDCRCEGPEHVNMMCFVTRPPEPTIGDLLRELGAPPGDHGIRKCLMLLVTLTGLK